MRDIDDQIESILLVNILVKEHRMSGHKEITLPPKAVFAALINQTLYGSIKQLISIFRNTDF